MKTSILSFVLILLGSSAQSQKADLDDRELLIQKDHNSEIYDAHYLYSRSHTTDLSSPKVIEDL